MGGAFFVGDFDVWVKIEPKRLKSYFRYSDKDSGKKTEPANPQQATGYKPDKRM